MPRKGIEVILIICVFIGSFVVISESSKACFSWEVTVEDNTNGVDENEYTLYGIEVSLRPGCRSTYWLTFDSDEPADWDTVILNESGGVIPYGVEVVFSGTVTVMFTLKVMAPDIMVSELATITTYIRANDKYNQDETEEIYTYTTAHPDQRSPSEVTLSQSENTTNSIKLQWTQNVDSDFDRYEVHMGSFNDFTPVGGTLITTIENQGTTEYNLTGLSAGSMYYFIVRVWDDEDQITGGPYFTDSNLLIAYTPGVNYKPEAVLLNDPTDITNRSAFLSWSKNTEEDFAQYEIHASRTPGFIPNAQTRFVDPIKDQNIVEYDVTGLDENATTYFKVKVKDTGGLSNDSNEVSCTTLDYIPCPSTLREPYDTTHSSTRLSWSQNCDTDFDCYEVHMSQTSGFTPSAETLEESIDSTVENNTIILGLDDQTTYYFIVRVCDKGGHYSDSNEVRVTTDDITSPEIIYTWPNNDQNDIDDLSHDVVVTFNEQMNTSSLTFTCSPDPGGWDFDWVDNDQEIHLQHSDFDDGTQYTFEITYAEDISGNDLTSGNTPNPWTFSTKDLTPPEIISTDPENSETDVPVTTTVSITFSEPMDHISVEGAITTSFSCSKSWNGNEITLTPYSELDYYTQYTIIVSTDAMDEAGNHLSSSYSFKFKTEAKDVNHAPVVSVSSPDNDVVDEGITISWSATDQDGDVLTIDLFYDMDTNPGNGMTLIISGIGNSGSYPWDTTDIDEGDYYVYVTVDDGDKLVGSYSGKLTIDHPDEIDTDGDGIPDTVDSDDDNDGIPDDQEDLDGDGILDDDETDPLDPDTDDDGYDDNEDDFPRDKDRWDIDIHGQDDSQDKDADKGKGEDSLPLILLGIIICAILISVIVGVWKLASGKKGTLSGDLISCPRCGQQFEPEASRAPYVQCPYCGTSGMLK